MGLLISALTMSQYFSDIDLGIDNLLMEPYLTTLATFPGRMALSTAFAYMILNSGLLLSTFKDRTWYVRSLTTICAGIVIASVIATVIGYKSDLQPLFGWSATTYMALHSALGIFMLGMGLLICSLISDGNDPEHNHLPLAAAGFIVIATATLLLWSGLTRQRDEQLQDALDANVNLLSLGINSIYREHVNTLDRMSRRWVTGGGTARAIWETDARSFTESLPGIRAMYWVDPQGQLLWQIPATGSSLAAVTDITTQPELTAQYMLARETRKTTFSMPEVLSLTDSRFFLVHPLYIEERFDGAIVAEFQAAQLFTAASAQNFAVPFQINFDGVPVYRNELVATLEGTDHVSVIAPLALTEGGWSLQVMDAPELHTDFRSLLPEVVLTIGMVMAALFSALLGLWSISKRHLIEANLAHSALLQSERQLNQFRTTLDRTLDCVFMIDARSLLFFYGNEGALRMTGCTAAELYSKHPWDVNPDLTEEQFRTRIAPLIQKEIDSTTYDTIQLSADGSRVPVECFLQYISPSNEAPRFVAIMRDITQRKRVEQMKSEFVSTVSHELRTPLTSISGALGLVSGGALGEVPVAVQDMIDIAYKNSRRLTHLINDLLDIEKIAAGKVNFDMQSQPLMPLLEQVVEGTRTYGTENNVSLQILHQLPAVHVRIDSQRLLQILSNLLSNAIKFSPEGGVVEIGVEQRANKVRISVRDHGRGIPEEFRGRIFQKFAQADASDTRKQSGTGLGLAISRELAERMGGFLSFDATISEGACFFLELPISNQQFIAATPTTGEEASAPRLLVVEDEPDAALLLQQLLKNAGYLADIAPNGNAALQALQHNSYAAVVLDLMLPDMHGIDIIRALKKHPRTADLPVIVVSAHTEDGQLRMNGDCSDIVWLTKPIDTIALLDQIDKIVVDAIKGTRRVLHIEDDADLHAVIRGMAGNGCDFSLATTLAAARQQMQKESFGAVILDLELPDGSGWDLLPDITNLQPNARLIILTGKDTTPADANKVDSILLKSRVTPGQLLSAIHARLET